MSYEKQQFHQLLSHCRNTPAINVPLFNQNNHVAIPCVKEIDIVGMDVETIYLFVCLPDVGWIDAKLWIDDDVFTIPFSDTYPPFIEFLSWTTQIINNQHVDLVYVNDEYHEHFFNVEKTNKTDKLLFEYVRSNGCSVCVYRKALIEKKNLVETFYFVLRYLMSIDFEQEEKKHSDVWFHFDHKSDDIIKLDLSALESYLKTA